MTDAALLFSPVAAGLEAVESCLLESARDQHPLLAEALRYVFDAKGKRLRPALVLLAGALGSCDQQALVLLAASLETVHTASLVHDDTLDEALTRRGLETVNSLWDRHTAIVTGDYLFARSAELASRLDNVRIMHMLSETVMAMCAGEMRQHAAAGNWLIGIDEYLERIGSKTASLFAMCCSGAGVVSGQSESAVEALRAFGYSAGLTFQIVDDILDFEADPSALGKPAGSDLSHGTITLPVILLMGKLSDQPSLRQRLQHGEDLQLALDLVRESGALSEAREHAARAARDAVAALALFPDSDSLRSLVEIAQYLPQRTR